jgi:(R,R)-butanediol dehydrogenase/meso-butanediol dehydrogenase/diacetyl reductase
MEATMLAAVYEGDQVVSVRSLPVPETGPGQALIEVSHCGICGSDLHFVVEGWAARPGSVHGHEYSGVIAAVGPDVHGWVVGDRVVGGPGLGCGTCRLCADGLTHLCVHRDRPGETPFQGAFATYKRLDVGSLFRIPDGLDLRAAALSEPVAVALRGVHRSRARPGDRVLVTGAGPIGLLTVAVLRAEGVDDVTVSEPGELRRQKALDVGASAVIAPDELPIPPSPTPLVDRPFQAAIDCSGRADAMVAALANLDRQGVLVLSGTGMARPQLDHLRIILHELVVTGSLEYSRVEFQEAIDLLASGRLPVARLVEPDDVPLSAVADAMLRLAGGELAGKVMVVPRA